MARVQLLDDPEAVQALTHPVRVRVLEALRTPDSAAGVSRRIGQSRQNANYHLKELERAGLVQRAGERRKGAFTEQLYRASASTYVVSPRVAWGDERRASTMRDQVALENLVALGERLQHDASDLLDHATFDGEEIASAAVEAEVRFADDEARAEFMADYLAALGPLLKKHGSSHGKSYRVAVAAYPDSEEGG